MKRRVRRTPGRQASLTPNLLLVPESRAGRPFATVIHTCSEKAATRSATPAMSRWPTGELEVREREKAVCKQRSAPGIERTL